MVSSERDQERKVSVIIWGIVGTLVMGLVVAVILCRMAWMWLMDAFTVDDDEEGR